MDSRTLVWVQHNLIEPYVCAGSRSTKLAAHGQQCMSGASRTHLSPGMALAMGMGPCSAARMTIRCCCCPVISMCCMWQQERGTTSAA